MKLIRKLIGLSALTLIFGGFFVGESQTLAKNSNFGKCVSGSFCDVVDKKTHLLSKVDKIKQAKKSYAINGLTECESKPTFFIGIDEDQDEIVASRRYDMFLLFSPSWLTKKCGRDVAELNNLQFKITDKRGRNYRIVEEKLWPNIYQDMCVVYVPCLHDARFDESYKDAGFEVDKGFRIASGEKYTVRLFDSSGKLIVKDTCRAVERNSKTDGYKGYIDRFAHSKQYDNNYYEKILKHYDDYRNSAVRFGKSIDSRC